MKAIISELNIIQIIINIKLDWIIIINIEVHLSIKNMRGGRPAMFIIKIVNTKLKFLSVIWLNLIDILDLCMMNEIDIIIIIYILI